jgi:protease IV
MSDSNLSSQSSSPSQSSSANQNQPEGWAQKTLETVALASIKEQQTARRWSNFFKILLALYLFTILGFSMGWFGGKGKTSGNHTALIEVAGVIEAGGDVNADSVMGSLQDAYDSEGTKGIILRINSPGGSPVQSGIIFDEIKRQKAMHPKIPVYAVVEDICASGGYYIAAAADKIYVDKASIVGSIGVLMDGYGFTETMKKVGVERRLLTAGENKAMLDPFSDVNPKHKAFAQTMLNEIHEQFKTAVRVGRGNRLKETPEVFSGLFWSGEQSIKLGLADAMGSADYVAREVIKEEEIVDFTYQETVVDRFAKKFGASVGASLAKTVGIDAMAKGMQLR